MSIQISIFDLIILLGIFQGLIISTLLFLTKKNRNSNHFLALGILSFCILSTKPLLHTLSLWETRVFGFFPNAFELALAPLFYFYIKSLLTPKFQFKLPHWFHFLPFLISQTYATIIYFSVLSTYDFSLRLDIANEMYFNEVKLVDEYILLFGTVLYLYHGLKLLRVYKAWLINNTSNTQLPDFNWLLRLFQLFAITALLLLIGRILSLLTSIEPIWFLEHFWKVLNLYIAFLIYYLGFKGYMQPAYSLPEIETFIKNPEPAIDDQISKRSRLIEAAMKDDKLFLDAELTIQSLSKHLALSQREISQTINQHFQTNFRDFINHYRIEEVKSKLNDPNYSKMSILGIAMESGFNSETSFYRLFKKHMGMTPKQFLTQNKD